MASNPSLLPDAIALLDQLSSAEGIHASLTERTNYRAVFTRDAVMAGIAAVAARSDAGAAAFLRTLERLGQLQGAQGQIPSNYLVEPGGHTAVSFGTLVPRIDACTWFMMGAAVAVRARLMEPAQLRAPVRRVVELLDALEYNGRGLLYCPPGGNWADEYLTEGYVLYDQVLRAWALRLLAEPFDEPRWGADATRITHAIGAGFWPEGAIEWQRPIASFAPTGRRETFDLAACALLALSHELPDRGAATLDWITTTYLERDRMPPAFDPVIAPGSPDWPALRRYHLHEFRNDPHHYHNGGIWPVWLGWLGVAYHHAGQPRQAQRLRALLSAAITRAGGWRFEEYLHGVTGAPGGTPHMAYSATGVILLHHADSPALAAMLRA